MSDISVVIPHLPERPDLLARCLRGIDAQTLPPAAVHLAIDAERLGMDAGRNRALASVRTEWTAVTDDDDEWLPHHLATLYQAAQDSGADLVYSHHHLMAGHPEFHKPFDPALARRRTIVHPSGLLMRTELARGVGGFQCPHQPGKWDEQPDGCPYRRAFGGCLAGEFGLVNALLDRGTKIVLVPEITFYYHASPEGAAAQWETFKTKLGAANDQRRP